MNVFRHIIKNMQEYIDRSGDCCFIHYGSIFIFADLPIGKFSL
ncbi:MAG: hypothetical protein ACE3JP_12620 [Ectobacillus sp.]